MVLGLILCGNAYANPIKTYWVVKKVITSGIFLKSEDIIGKEQFF